MAAWWCVHSDLHSDKFFPPSCSIQLTFAASRNDRRTATARMKRILGRKADLKERGGDGKKSTVIER